MKLMPIYQSLLHESIEVWHGSPYNFNKFDITKLNTGIGSQAFGWGFYFTQDKNSAKGFAETLEDTVEVQIDKVQPTHTIAKYIANIRSTHGTNRELILHILKSNAKDLMLRNKITRDEYNFIVAAKKITSLHQNKFLYQVVLHDGKSPNAYDYINWTRDVTTEQINKIAAQMAKEHYSGRVTIEDGQIYKTIGDKTEISKGRDVYYAFAGDVGFNQKEASMFLLRAGIDGIKYPSNGGYDYVVFDPSEISIKNKVRF